MVDLYSNSPKDGCPFRLPWFPCPALPLLDDEEVGVIRRFKPQAQFVRGRGLDVQGKVSIRDGIVGGDRRPAAIDLPDLDSELLRRQSFREVSSHHVIRDHESIAVRLEREEDEDIAVVEVRVLRAPVASELVVIRRVGDRREGELPRRDQARVNPDLHLADDVLQRPERGGYIRGFIGRIRLARPGILGEAVAHQPVAGRRQGRRRCRSARSPWPGRSRRRGPLPSP